MATQPNSTSPDDRELVRRVQIGDHGAFECLVRTYQDRIYAVCLRLTSDPEAAKDLAQEAFLKALRAIRQFEGKSSFYTWIYRIAVNLALTERRRRKTVRVHLESQMRSAGDDGQAAGLQMMAAQNRHESPAAGRPVETLDAKERRRAVHQALGQLEEEQRVILVLRDMESFDYRAIADILEIPLGTVRSRLHRARLACVTC